jgi:hypothetical protein
MRIRNPDAKSDKSKEQGHGYIMTGPTAASRRGYGPKTGRNKCQPFSEDQYGNKTE